LYDCIQKITNEAQKIITFIKIEVYMNIRKIIATVLLVVGTSAHALRAPDDNKNNNENREIRIPEEPIESLVWVFTRARGRTNDSPINSSPIDTAPSPIVFGPPPTLRTSPLFMALRTANTPPIGEFIMEESVFQPREGSIVSPGAPNAQVVMMSIENTDSNDSNN
jgi:hypothetical protein